jgi:hypothetical protein
MKKSTTLAALVLGLVGALAAAPAYANSINPVVQYTSTSNVSDPRAFTLGYEFTTTTTFDINALGVWDTGPSTGSSQNQQVGIWDSSGNLLVSTTVLGTAPDIDNFQWAPVSYSLAPGTYTIGATFYNTDFPNQATGITTLAGYTWVSDEQIIGGGLNEPTNSIGGYGDNGILWADFSVQAPEGGSPWEFLVLAAGCMASAFGNRHRRA